jgi:preprotein translocase subunit SecA
MSVEETIRPGIVHGPYPERRDPGRNAWDRTADRLFGALVQRRFERPSVFRRVTGIVAQAGRGLERVSDARLQVLATQQRVRLRREGLSDVLAAQAFALVREVSRRVLGMRPFDVQVFGGWAMLKGMVAEMETGEGKTLTATLPACTAAMAGIPVHVITVNDYLVSRDAQWTQPVYEMLGLTAAAATAEMEMDARRVAYACDVTYCTNKQVAFDYLRDRLMLRGSPGRLRLQVARLYEEPARTPQLLLRGLCFAIIDEADSVLIDEARTPLIISGQGDASDQQHTFEQALTLARGLRRDQDYTVEPREREIRLTDPGADRLESLTRSLGAPWTGRRRREELIRMALSALHFYVRDQQYLVREGKVQIVDEFTGRVMPDRSWERGLHQVIEVKEGCEVTGQRETLARVSYQQFFRRYLHLAGMSGTVKETVGELRSVYGLNVVTVPTHRPVQRRAFPDRVYRVADAKWSAIVARVSEMHRQGRPVLVGTRSVAASEHLSALLTRAGLAHQVLNARQDVEESEIIARAGERGRITVATNMAGRGTDIKLGPGVTEVGGLHVIASERHESQRIDRQLFGRCGRQGDPGSFEAVVAVEDELVSLYAPPGFVGLLGGGRGDMPPWGRLLVALAQSRAERHNARIRRDLLKVDEHLGNTLAFTGPRE